MNLPEIPDEYIRHYVRGLFDGDGSVYLDSGKYIRISLLSGSFSFIDSLNNKLNESGFPLSKIYGGYAHQKNAHYIRYVTEHARAFFNFIYRDVSELMYYTRKHQVFLDYFNAECI